MKKERLPRALGNVPRRNDHAFGGVPLATAVAATANIVATTCCGPPDCSTGTRTAVYQALNTDHAMKYAGTGLAVQNMFGDWRHISLFAPPPPPIKPKSDMAAAYTYLPPPRECLCGKIIYGPRPICSPYCHEKRALPDQLDIEKSDPRHSWSTINGHTGGTEHRWAVIPIAGSSHEHRDHPDMRHPMNQPTMDNIKDEEEEEGHFPCRPMMSLSAALSNAGKITGEKPPQAQKTPSFSSFRSALSAKLARTRSPEPEARPCSPLATSPTVIRTSLSDSDDSYVGDGDEWVRTSLYGGADGELPVAINGLSVESSKRSSKRRRRGSRGSSSTRGPSPTPGHTLAPPANVIKKAVSSAMLLSPGRKPRNMKLQSASNPDQRSLSSDSSSSAESSQTAVEAARQSEDGTWTTEHNLTEDAVNVGKYGGSGWPVSTRAYALRITPMATSDGR